MRVLFALPGLHRVRRGAEVVLESVAQQIALEGKHEVSLIGSGLPIADRAYHFKRVPAVPRDRFERWPALPFLRNEYMYEELTFAAALIMKSWRDNADLTMTCGYPYTNWALRSSLPRRNRPAHVFVTQNGDWPAYQRRWESRFFSCDGLVCTNPVYFERNRERWFSTLIPNGVAIERFHPGPGDRASLGLPQNRPVVLMVSALEEGKRVLEAMHAVARVADAFLVVAGDGALRNKVDDLAAELLPGRFVRKTFPHEQMPGLYRSANVFLHAAIRESFGNVYIEALASGLPVVAHDDEVTRWILGDHAYLVDARSELELVDTLETVLYVSKNDLARGTAFAQANYNWRAIAARYCEFFSEVLQRATP
jgi:glycosyltransferase involved in cell wall biosynthesis